MRTVAWRLGGLLGLILVGLLAGGCVCWFVPCDRMNHVSGHVRSPLGEPVEAADVVFYGVTRRTDERGCFHFGGSLAASRFQIEVRKFGFKQYSETTWFNLYDIDVVLERSDSPAQSRATWRVLARKEAEELAECRR